MVALRLIPVDSTQYKFCESIQQFRLTQLITHIFIPILSTAEKRYFWVWFEYIFKIVAISSAKGFFFRRFRKNCYTTHTYFLLLSTNYFKSKQVHTMKKSDCIRYNCITIYFFFFCITLYKISSPKTYMLDCTIYNN